MKPFGNKTGFILSYRAIGILL